MAKVTFLGNNANLTANRHPVSFVVDDTIKLLVDAGPTVVSQLYLAGYSVSDLDAIVVTHCHGDHTLGYPYLLFSKFFEGLGGKTGPSEVPLIALREVAEGLQSMVAFCYPPGKYPGFDIVPQFACGNSETVFTIGNAVIRTVPVSHAVPNIALRIEFADGATLAYSSDTVQDESVINLAKGCDLLIHEAFATSQMRQLAARAKHALADEAGQVAQKAGVKRLALVHLMPQFVGKEQLIIDEAKQYFDGDVFVPDALTSVEL